MKIAKGKYVYLCLCTDEEKAPLLVMSPAHVDEDDLLEVTFNDDTFAVRVTHVSFLAYGDDDFNFAVACFGDDPIPATGYGRFYETNWESHIEKEEKEEENDDAVRAD